MADDYIGKKMEDYRRGINASAYRRKITPTGTSRGIWPVKFPARIAFVTGGANGIGREIVKTLCQAGCRVAFCDTDTQAGTATAQATGSQFHPVDVADADALDSALCHVIKAWGGLDVIVNNVGIGNFKPLTESDITDFDRIIATNLRPVYVTARRMAIYRSSLPQLPELTGRIINISSTRAAMSEAGTEGYSASKGAIESLTHALMMSMAPLRVTVNCVAPGWINVDPNEKLRDADHEFHPSGRVGCAADVAQTVTWLCSPGADFINGEIIRVDGGVTRKMIYPS
ncbi:MAG: SDR family oxidoreductase [Muribaculaceae bacterium]|nr:SDR family oxidoreductase [Muribaculaceae bacterium]